MSHANATLTPRGRLYLARCVVEDGWPLRRAAERFQVSPTTAKRWADRYREHGPSAMGDRSSRPHHSPRRTSRRLEAKIKHLRTTKQLGPVQIAGRLDMNSSTVGRVIARLGLPKLVGIDRATGLPVRRDPVVRYEHPHPGDLVHVDIKKLGNIPDGGGWRIHGRSQGGVNSQAHRDPDRPRKVHGRPNLGYAYIHTAIDDHTRLAYCEIHADEQGATAAGFWRRAVAWFNAIGIHIRRVLTDNGSCYRSRTWAVAIDETGCRHSRTRPYRPQTNGKAERFNRTLLTEWAYAKPYSSETARRRALPAWLHIYNHHRAHSSLAGHPPISRVTNLPGQYS
ncbi:IS481 family transposase [Nocardioides currus]|uniref:IS481 family transposase n=1 Tax=Nocardioides currus TaxID=2133958 RepID=A0A2R7YYG8_9ACTN|nr:IS481 family transposase [Nocardioides currus]PUA80919.1 IS481 family transposase [Nocardioides currus]